MRTNGNLALKPVYRSEYQSARVNQEKKAVAKCQVTKEKARTVNIAVAIFYIAIISAIAFCLISREVSLYEKSSEISRLENQLEQAQTETKQAKIAAESKIDLKGIEEAATTKFGMSRPEKSQTVYINIAQDDYVEKVAKKDVGLEIQQSIQSSIKNLFGIFGVQ